MVDNEAFQVFSSNAPLEKLIVVKNGEDSVLVCYSGSDLFIYNVKGSNAIRDSWSKAELCFNRRFDSPIVDIVQNEKVFIILDNGHVWVLVSDDYQCCDENDIFEMENSPEITHSWRLEDMNYIPGSPTFLSCSPSKLGVCVIVEVDNNIQVFLINNQIIRGSALCQGSSSASVCVVDISCLSFDFMNLWLPHVERTNEFLFVGLSDGAVYCYPLSLPLKFYIIYKSVHSIVKLSWFQDRNSDRFDSLIIVLDSGAVVRLTPIGEEISFPFLPFLNSAVAVNNCILSLGEYNSRFLLLDDISNKSKSFPVSDVVTACSANNNSKIFLVSDINSHVHLINLEKDESLKISISDSNQAFIQKLPRLCDLQKLIASSIQLSKKNLTVKTNDEYLRAKSLVTRADLLKEHFSVSVKVVQMLGNDHTIRVNISFNLPGIVFSKDFWKLDVIVSTMTSTNIYRQDLVFNLSSDKKLIQLVTIPLSFDLLFNFECKLMSYIETKKMDLYLPLGKVEMDASHFLFPPSVKELSPWDPKSDLFWNNNFKYSLAISLKEFPKNIHEFLSQLLSASKALWRNSEWNKMIKGCEVSCILFGHNVEFKIKDDHISVESLNLKACQAVRLSLLIKLSKKQSLEHRENLAQCLMSWYQAENIMRLSKNPQNFVTDLYNILKNTS